MKKKIIYILLAIIFIIAIIITAVKGLNVGIIYSEGTTVTFTQKNDVNIQELKAIAKEIWPNEKILVQKVEFFNDSALIKTKEITDEQISSLCDKINEKYSSELKTSDFAVEHVSNVKVRSIIEPFIIPVGLSTLLVLGYYAIRFKGIKQMLCLLKNLVIAEILLFSVYAIARIPVNGLAMPLFMTLYIGVITGYTVFVENKKSKDIG